MKQDIQPRGYSSAGYVAIIDGRRMEFATYEEYREYVCEDAPESEEAA